MFLLWVPCTVNLIWFSSSWINSFASSWATALMLCLLTDSSLSSLKVQFPLFLHLYVDALLFVLQHLFSVTLPPLLRLLPRFLRRFSQRNLCVSSCLLPCLFGRIHVIHDGRFCSTFPPLFLLGEYCGGLKMTQSSICASMPWQDLLSSYAAVLHLYCSSAVNLLICLFAHIPNLYIHIFTVLIQLFTCKLADKMSYFYH